jgi:hypothetical protein
MIVDRQVLEQLGGDRRADKINPGLRETFPERQYRRYRENRIPQAKSRPYNQNFFKLFVTQIDPLFP